MNGKDTNLLVETPPEVIHIGGITSEASDNADNGT